MLSKKVFWNWFKAEVQTRWTRHNFEWIEIGDWHWRLRDFDVDTLTQAVRQHKAVDDWRTPSLKKVHDYAKKIHTTNHPPVPSRIEGKHKSTIPDTHTFIMCTSKDDRGKRNLGWFVDILICPLNKTHSPETYQHIAAKQAARHQATYGGGWEVFTQTNQLEMLQRAMKLRGCKPLDLNDLRKPRQSRYLSPAKIYQNG